MDFISIEHLNLNKPNLLLLAQALRDVHTHPEEYSHTFDMHYLRAATDEYYSDNRFTYAICITEPDCGAAACALGWAPMVKGLEPILEEYYSNRIDASLNIDLYIKNKFNLHANITKSLGLCIFSYLFEGNWKFTDNSALGAALRIEHILDKGLPENWQKQILNKEQATYWPEAGQSIDLEV